jgi:26S proteasome regulatory subunit N9
MALQYVEAQRQLRPDLSDWYASLADLYQRKLWHQLTLKLDQFLQLQVTQVRFLFLLYLSHRLPHLRVS